MKVSEQDVSYVADLANLELTDDERTRMVRDLNSILEHIDRLNQLDTSDVEPMAQVFSAPAEQGGEVTSMREDELRPSIPHEEAVRNAPQTDGTYFRVPKVIEK
jgi:aspartyl-tRNA(Asn)/glutamyl-tRNA(Gln) amidotransferase subunit C